MRQEEHLGHIETHHNTYAAAAGELRECVTDRPHRMPFRSLVTRSESELRIVDRSGKGVAAVAPIVPLYSGHTGLRHSEALPKDEDGRV